MKNTALRALALALVLPATSAMAQQKMDDMKGMTAKPAAGAPMAHKAMGTVEKVDARSRLVTVAHGPVKTMNWPAMTMTFEVKDKALLHKFADGKKVEFEFIQQGKDYVVTAVK